MSLLSHEAYMARALELAVHGRNRAHPNPVVGAVIVDPSGRIIGEGYHRACGGPHAEVNAMRSVNEADLHLINKSTIYVTLEPCAHQGRTPSCAKMLVEKGIGRVVVGAGDPFPKVSGKGIAILREAGIPVIEGVLEQQCKAVNLPFITSQISPYPYITLKWAQSADGFLDRERTPDIPAPLKISTRLSSLAVDRLRAENDGIMVGSGTVIADNPRLGLREWHGKPPVKIVLDRRGRVDQSAQLFEQGDIIWITSSPAQPVRPGIRILTVSPHEPLDRIVSCLRDEGISTLLVEGGSELLTSLIDLGLWHEARVETASFATGGKGRGSVNLSSAIMTDSYKIDGNLISHYINSAPLL
ncbi:MAG: bifunctional diaminohydroxyphosphoribosylaminopyrimidine deaminase/5-amino-6-(5-phosphoribosylamino)uracil reductase RibD [Paramuribaculum sp.]|nr:bifunctional diaminohydroxyphosphoribosylaminopyrimidine deaminase/5-amino-6-(5-phosphoribosylamino)uracil reductase RibD [Paramuribaculum sp.]MDE6304802.1 bifunctional diaminohydroxyphosphoribosylaminopyrimidine deaminase/5-amino-6-(5-phosphoribosylamino)uracil reductase RibD [Paramuribaculum sp.]